MKIRTLKRPLSLLLAAVMLLTLLPTAALAEEMAVEPIPCVITQDCTLTDGHEGECAAPEPPADLGAEEKAITGWIFVGGELTEGELALPGVSPAQQADHDTVVSMLPTAISAEVDGETEAVQVSITGWSCPEYVQDEGGNWPVSGAYVFTATLEEGYVCDSSPAVTVRLGDAQVYNDIHYIFFKEYGHLEIMTNEGTTAWLDDQEIGSTKQERQQAIKTVNIAPEVTEIKEQAFQNCTNLGRVSFLGILDNTAQLKTIGKAAFESCSKMEMVALPAGLEHIGAGAFDGCTQLNVSLPSGLKVIGDGAFSGCKSITEVSFPAGIGAVGGSVFSGCAGLESVTLPADVTAIGAAAFYDCVKLKTINLPDGMKTIGYRAFYNCNGLTSLPLPASLEEIGGMAFYSCENLTIVTFPNRLHTIGGQAFNDCVKLTSLTFPASLKSIGNQAFASCSGLNTLTFLGRTPPAVASNAFENIPGTGSLYFPDGGSGYDLNWQGALSLTGWTPTHFPTTLEVRFDNDGTGGVSQTENEMKTAVEAALGAHNKAFITTLRLTGNAGSITGHNWKYLRDLFAADNGWDALTTLDLSAMSHLARVAYPLAGVTQIPKLLGVSLPASLETIGVNAFSQCINLTEVTFPAKLQSIETLAFYNCASLHSLTFQSGQAPTIAGAFTTVPKTGALHCLGIREGYDDQWLAGSGLSGWTLYRKNAQTIEKSTYDTAAPLVGETVTSSDGAYTPNDGGPAGTHLYQWKRADNADRTGNVTDLSTAKDYTTAPADFGKYIWLETTPVGNGTLAGEPVQGDVLQVGVKLTVTVSGGSGGTNPTVNGADATGGVVVYGPAEVSFVKTQTADDVSWSAAPNEGSFSTLTGVPTTYTPAASPSGGTITLTASMVGYGSTTCGAFTVTGNTLYYEWSEPLLTIKTGANLTIQNTNPAESTVHRIKVEEGAKNVTLTLAGVNIDVGYRYVSAFEMAGAEVTLTLAVFGKMKNVRKGAKKLAAGQG